MAGRLVGLQGALIGQSVMLGAETTLGRDAGNTLILHDQTVGRHHAVIRHSGTCHILEDLGSTNGTFVNERRIQDPTTLGNGDIVRLGSQVLRYEETQGAPSPRIEVSRGEAGARRPVENPGLFRNVTPGLNAGCLDINLEGCLRWLLIVIIVLVILMAAVFVLGLLAGGLGGLAGLSGAAGAGGGAVSTAPAGGSSPPPAAGPEEGGRSRSKRGGPVLIVAVKVDYGRRLGFTGIVPIVLITWQNVGPNPISQVRAKVTGYDSHGRETGTIDHATMYAGPPVQPGEQHQDTLQAGGIVAVPSPDNKLRQAPKRASVDVEDAR